MKIIDRLETKGLLGNQYYVFGLAVQKGVPIIAIPLLVNAFGVSVYGEFVLLYTVVQLYSNLSCLSLPQVLISFWYRQENKAEISAAVTTLLVVLAVIVLVPGVPVLVFILEFLKISLTPFEFVFWVVVYGFLLNINSYAVGIVRVHDRRKLFFFAALLGAIFYFFLIEFLRYFNKVSLSALIALHCSSVLVTFFVLILKDYRLIFLFSVDSLGRHWKGLLSQAMPLCFYIFLTLYGTSVDKWMIKAWFDESFFNQYVLNAQLSYSIILVPTAIALHAGPVISRLVASGDLAALTDYEARTSLLILVGSVAMSIVAAIYAFLTGLDIGLGYLILVIGYLVEGQYILKSLRLMSELRSFDLAIFVIPSVILLTIALFVVCSSSSQIAIYFCVPIYQVLQFSFAYFMVNRLKKSRF